MTQTFTQDVFIDGSADATQLRTQGNSTQTQPLQTWEDSGANILARVTGDGLVQAGDPTLSPAVAMVEANEAIVPSSAKPKQGWQSLGRITGSVSDAISGAISWVVHELELLGSGPISGLHVALRAKLTHNSIGNSTAVELRAADLQAINQSGISGTPVNKLTGARGTACNGPGAYLAKAIGVEATVTNDSGGNVTDASAIEVAPPVNAGTLVNFYGVRVPDLNASTLPGVTNRYAIYTGDGPVHLGDHEELKLLASAPAANPPANFVKFYTKLVTGVPHLFAKDAAGVEYDLSATGGANTLDVIVTAGEALAVRDFAYLSLIDNKAYKIDTDASPVRVGVIRGIVTTPGGIANGANGTLRFIGEVTGFSGLTPMMDVWAATTPGGYTQTRPTVLAAGGQLAQVRLGFASSATAIMVAPTPVNFLKREQLANNVALTIEHFIDALARARRVSAYVTTVTNTSLTNYASSNQDTDVPLRGPTGGGGTTTITASGSNAAIGTSGGNPVWEAQTFMVPTGTLTQITVTLGPNVGSPSGTITWEIRSGGPSGALLQSGTFTPVANSTNTIPVSNGPSLDGATTYALILKPTNSQVNGVYWTWQTSTGDVYANGQNYQSLSSGGSWIPVSVDCWCSIQTVAGSTKDKLAQSIQVAASGVVDKVNLWLKKVGNPTGTLTLRVETDNAGNPSGTLVDANATVNVAENTLGTTYANILFDFLNNFSLNASTTYWLVLSTTRAASSTDYVNWGADGSSPTYSQGELRSQAGGTYSAENKDGVFDVIGAATTYQEPCVLGRDSGGTRDLAVRFDNGAGLNNDTLTTFKNVSGVTLDVTCAVTLP